VKKQRASHTEQLMITILIKLSV